MNHKITTTNYPLRILESILEELRLLREEVKLLLPHEDLEDYANPKEIKQAYQNAIKKYPRMDFYK